MDKEYPDNVFMVGGQPGEYDPWHDLDIRAMAEYARARNLNPIPPEVVMMFQKPRKE